MKNDRKTERWDHPPLDRRMFDNSLLLKTRYSRPSPLLAPHDPILINNKAALCNPPLYFENHLFLEQFLI
jgi:hypothetical protein